jgi:hypothetical protein
MSGKAVNTSAWAYLGVDVREGTPIDVLNSLNEKMATMSNTDKGIALNRLGLSASLLPAMGNIKQDNSLNGLVATPKEQRQIKEMNAAFREMRLTLSLIRDRFVATATPVKLFFELVTRLVKIFDTIIKKTIGWERFSKVLTISIMGLMFALKPVVFWIGALALVIEDLWVYFNGGESATKKVIEWFNNLDIITRTLILAFMGLIGAMQVQKVLAFGSALVSSIKGFETAFMAANGKFITSPLGQFFIASAMGVVGGRWVGKKIGEWGEKTSGEGGLADKIGNSLLNAKDRIKGVFNRNSNNNANIKYDDNKTVNITINGGNISEVENAVNNTVNKPSKPVITQNDLNKAFEGI